MLLKQNDILNADGFHVAETVLAGGTLTFKHTHDFYEVFLVTGGQVSHLINGEEEQMGEGALRLVFPEDSHRFRTSPHTSAAFVNLAFSPELYRLALKIFGSYATAESSGRMVLLPAPLREAVLLKLLYPFCGMAGMFRVPRRDMLVGVLLDCLCFFRAQGSGGTAVPAWLSGVCDALRKNRNYVRGIKRFVELSGKTQEHLTRSMKRYYNISPSAYINGLRLGEAARLLSDTGRGVLDIQLECGFDSTAHFNKLFKAEFGVSPSRYRSLNRMVINEFTG